MLRPGAERYTRYMQVVVSILPHSWLIQETINSWCSFFSFFFFFFFVFVCFCCFIYLFILFFFLFFFFFFFFLLFFQKIMRIVSPIIFPRKHDLTFHANCLQFVPLETICMKCQIMFSGKNKKKTILICSLLEILKWDAAKGGRVSIMFHNFCL